METLELIQHIRSEVDRTQKLIYTLNRPSGPVTIEVSAIDKQDGKFILCLPTQTACAQACRFCHTTMLAGVVAVTNLTGDELRAIVIAAWAESGYAAYETPLLISFMGVGEPMANASGLLAGIMKIAAWATLIRDLKVRFAFATMLPGRHLVDFVGFMNAVQGLNISVKAHLSLHYTTDTARQEWMPASSLIAVALSLMHEYAIRTGNPVEIHYTLIQGVNDTMQDADRLCALLADTKIPVKFLKLNPIPGDESRAPDSVWVEFFRSQLENRGIPTEWYDSPGSSIGSACGMFATDVYIPTDRPEPVWGKSRLEPLLPILASASKKGPEDSYLYESMALQAIREREAAEHVVA